MSRRIEIPGYETALENCVWKREAEPIKHPKSDELVSAREFLLLSRYRAPSDGEVIDFLKEAASKSSSPLILPAEGLEGEIISHMGTLPQKEIENIASGNFESIAHLIKHIPHESLAPGRSYLEMSRMILPDFVLDSGKKVIEREGLEAYRFAFNHMGAGRWHAKLRLDEEKNEIVLPKKEDIEALVKCGVTNSDVLMVKLQEENANYMSVGKSVRLLYDFLSNKSIRYLIDRSDHALKVKSFGAVNNLAACLTGKMVVAGLVDGGLLDIISEKLGGVDPSKKRKSGMNGFTHYGDCSNN